MLAEYLLEFNTKYTMSIFLSTLYMDLLLYPFSLKERVPSADMSVCKNIRYFFAHYVLTFCTRISNSLGDFQC